MASASRSRSRSSDRYSVRSRTLHRSPPPQQRSRSPSDRRGRNGDHRNRSWSSERRNGNQTSEHGRRRSHSRRSRSRSRSASVDEQAFKSTKVVVEKLTKNVNLGHLQEIFGKYGPIKDIDMPMNKHFNTNRGTAYIIFIDSESAESAIAHMHEAQLDGAVVNVSIVLSRKRLHQSPPPARRPPTSTYPDRPPPASHRDRGPPPNTYAGPTGRYRSPPRRRSPPPPARESGGRGRASQEAIQEAAAEVTQAGVEVEVHQEDTEEETVRRHQEMLKPDPDPAAEDGEVRVTSRIAVTREAEVEKGENQVGKGTEDGDEIMEGLEA